MKKIILVAAILSVGILVYSKPLKKENIQVKQNVEKIESTKTSKIGASYEAEMLKRMEAIQKEVQPDLDSGVTADMSNAAQKLEGAWKIEMKKVYDLLLSELPENEKIKLKKEQEKWAKKVEENLKKSDDEKEGGTIEALMKAGKFLGSTENRALELAKRYDELQEKK